MFFAIREFDIFTNGRCVKKIRIKSFARYLGIGIAMFVIICLDWKIFGI
jgi:hypothetical protein